MSSSSDDEYKVGYGKPPREHRFKKGSSGNPAGRPKGAKNKPFVHSLNPFVDSVLRAAEQTVPVRDGGERVEMSVFDATLRQVGLKAALGEFRFSKLFLETVNEASQERLQEVVSQVRSVEAYKAQWEPVFEHARRNGLPEPKQLPHPDHVNICSESGLVRITGPDTPELKEAWGTLKRALRSCEEMLREARQHLERQPCHETWKMIVSRHSRTFRRLKKNVPPGWDWREGIGNVDKPPSSAPRDASGAS